MAMLDGEASGEARKISGRSGRQDGHAAGGPVGERVPVQQYRRRPSKIRVSTVNPVMAKQVWDAIKELDYFPNTQARALVSGRSRLLGLIVSEITNPFFPELIQRFEDTAVDYGYEILISSTNYDPKRMSLCIRRMLERRGRGRRSDDLWH